MFGLTISKRLLLAKSSSYRHQPVGSDGTRPPRAGGDPSSSQQGILSSLTIDDLLILSLLSWRLLLLAKVSLFLL